MRAREMMTVFTCRSISIMITIRTTTQSCAPFICWSCAVHVYKARSRVLCSSNPDCHCFSTSIQLWTSLLQQLQESATESGGNYWWKLDTNHSHFECCKYSNLTEIFEFPEIRSSDWRHCDRMVGRRSNKRQLPPPSFSHFLPQLPQKTD